METLRIAVSVLNAIMAIYYFGKGEQTDEVNDAKAAKYYAKGCFNLMLALYLLGS